MSAPGTPAPRPPKRPLALSSASLPNMSSSTSSPNGAALSSNASLLTPISEPSATTQRKSREFSVDEPHRPSKLVRMLDNDEPAHNRKPAIAPVNKTLHSIDYITQQPSPVDDRFSLPPLHPRLNKTPVPPRSSTYDPATVPHTQDPTYGPPATPAKSSNHPPSILNDNVRNCECPIKYDLSAERPSHGIAACGNHSASLTSQQQHQVQYPLPHLPQAMGQQLTFPGAPVPPSTQTSTTSVATLESQLIRLKHYSDELLSLSLHDSHHLLQDEIKRQEDALLLAKRERSERLVRGLEAEFPGLVDVREAVKREGARLGYF